MDTTRESGGHHTNMKACFKSRPVELDGSHVAHQQYRTATLTAHLNHHYDDHHQGSREQQHRGQATNNNNNRHTNNNNKISSNNSNSNDNKTCSTPAAFLTYNLIHMYMVFGQKSGGKGTYTNTDRCHKPCIVSKTLLPANDKARSSSSSDGVGNCGEKYLFLRPLFVEVYHLSNPERSNLWTKKVPPYRGMALPQPTPISVSIRRAFSNELRQRTALFLQLVPPADLVR